MPLPLLVMPTPHTLTRCEIEIKHSRFISSAHRVHSTEEAREFIAGIRAEFPDARHHCSAFSVTPSDSPNPILHSSDDGEPSGTAGRPMLDVLTGSGIHNVAVVVTRYFGGTLLGTGGLVRAYSDAVRDVLARTPLVQAQQSRVFLARLTHTIAGKVESELRTRNYSILSTTYTPKGVELRIATLPTQTDGLLDVLATLSSGTARPQDEGWITTEHPVV